MKHIMFTRNKYLYITLINSSVGQQVMNKKRTEPIINLGKSTRDREKKRGVFNAMMERRPQSVRIQMPKF